MSERYTRPNLVRRINAMAETCGGAEHVVPIDADDLMDRARGSTNLEDFGGLGDGDWRRRFGALVDAVNASDLHVVGRLMTRQELLRCLRTRLLLTAFRARHPEVVNEPVIAPVVVTGPARSGTTILFELLGLDPSFRTPIAADVTYPMVPDGMNRENLLAMTECEQELWSDVQPELNALHEYRADLPVECVVISAPSFAGHHWARVLSTWCEWTMDLAADAAVHRAVLQAVQVRDGGAGRTWLLKTPAYLLALDSLFAAYPDVRLVLTHRDPAKTLPSNASISTMERWIRSDGVDAAAFAQAIAEVFTWAQSEVARRHAADAIPAPVVDVQFLHLVRDPVSAVRTVYEVFKLAWPVGHGDTIRDYLNKKPRGKFGRHGYTAQDWGLDAAKLRADLRDYVEHFAIELEDA